MAGLNVNKSKIEDLQELLSSKLENTDEGYLEGQTTANQESNLFNIQQNNPDSRFWFKEESGNTYWELYPITLFSELSSLIQIDKWWWRGTRDGKPICTFEIANTTPFYVQIGITTFQSGDQATATFTVEKTEEYSLGPNETRVCMTLGDSGMNTKSWVCEITGIHFSLNDIYPKRKVKFNRALSASDTTETVAYLETTSFSKYSDAIFSFAPSWTSVNRYIAHWKDKEGNQVFTHTSFPYSFSAEDGQADYELSAVWGYEYTVTLKPQTSVATGQITKVLRSMNASIPYTLPSHTFQINTAGYYFTTWAVPSNSGAPDNKAPNTLVQITRDVTIQAYYSNKYTLTYKHQKDSNGYYADSGTGHMECYQLLINGVDQGKRGAFSNGAKSITCTYGDTIEVACTYYYGGITYRKDQKTVVKMNGTQIANNQDTYPSGYYPYGSSGNLTFPKDNSSSTQVAYYKFKLTGPTTVNFIAYTNAPTVVDMCANWDCYITT